MFFIAMLDHFQACLFWQHSRWKHDLFLNKSWYRWEAQHRGLQKHTSPTFLMIGLNRSKYIHILRVICVYISQIFSLIFNPVQVYEWLFSEVLKRKYPLFSMSRTEFLLLLCWKRFLYFQHIYLVVSSVFAVSLHQEILNLHHITHFMNTQ